MSVNFTSPVVTKASKPHCRRCKKAFPSNNGLHHHLRADCNFRTAISAPPGGPKPLNDIEAYPAKSVTPSTTGATKGISNSSQSDTATPGGLTSSSIADSTISFELTIIRSSVDSSAEMRTDYEFRGWNYIKTQVSLSAEATAKNVCMNTGVGVTLVDRVFFKQQVPEGVIRIMTTPLKVRDLGTNRHES